MDILGQYNKEHSEVLRTEPQEMIYLPETPKIIQWVIRYSGGLIKGEKQAFVVLIGFIILAVTLSLILIFSGNGGQENVPQSFTDKPQFLP